MRFYLIYYKGEGCGQSCIVLATIEFQIRWGNKRHTGIEIMEPPPKILDFMNFIVFYQKRTIQLHFLPFPLSILFKAINSKQT